jgi:hypothetical protein
LGCYINASQNLVYAGEAPSSVLARKLKVHVNRFLFDTVLGHVMVYDVQSAPFPEFEIRSYPSSFEVSRGFGLPYHA